MDTMGYLQIIYIGYIGYVHKVNYIDINPSKRVNRLNLTTNDSIQSTPCTQLQGQPAAAHSHAICRKNSPVVAARNAKDP